MNNFSLSIDVSSRGCSGSSGRGFSRLVWCYISPRTNYCSIVWIRCFSILCHVHIVHFEPHVRKLSVTLSQVKIRIACMFLITFKVHTWNSRSCNQPYCDVWHVLLLRWFLSLLGWFNDKTWQNNWAILSRTKCNCLWN